jgi:exopolysaccharide biosynthesis polyprenyl glycosylphosphotransferase
MHVELPIYEGGKHVIKRGFDILVSATALVLLAPVFLIIAVLVRRDSPGPVFFRQQRIGRNGEPFSMIKFRSMVDDAEARLAELADQDDGNGVLFKLRADPRVTKIGRVLRTYSLDELPQLWNVLSGQMSLVGPRPSLPVEVEQYEQHVLRRLYLKPGLTGIWQVNGRSNLSWEESVRLDLYYVENWSLTGDLLILWRTVKVVLRPVGAY